MKSVVCVAVSMLAVLGGCAAGTPTSPNDVDPADRPRGAPATMTSKLATPHGEAAIDVVLDKSEIHPGERIALHLSNRGEVELLTGLAFIVEKWDGAAWVEVRDPSHSPDTFYAWPDVGIVLPPGRSTETQHWPEQATDDLQPGRYRVSKTALYEDPEFKDPARQLAADAVFEVTPRS